MQKSGVAMPPPPTGVAGPDKIESIWFCLQISFQSRAFIESFKKLFHKTTSRGGSRAAARSKMECFVIIANGFQPLTIITKRSILDVAAALDPLLTSKGKPSD